MPGQEWPRVAGSWYPAEFRKAVGLRAGDDVILLVEDGKIKISTPIQTIRHAQELVRHYVPAGRPLAKELIAERRTEVEDG